MTWEPEARDSRETAERDSRETAEGDDVTWEPEATWEPEVAGARQGRASPPLPPPLSLRRQTSWTTTSSTTSRPGCRRRSTPSKRRPPPALTLRHPPRCHLPARATPTRTRTPPAVHPFFPAISAARPSDQRGRLGRGQERGRGLPKLVVGRDGGQEGGGTGGGPARRCAAPRHSSSCREVGGQEGLRGRVHGLRRQQGEI